MLSGILPLQSQKPFVREVKAQGKWYHQTIIYVPDSSRIRVYNTDITAHKRAEKKLHYQDQLASKLNDAIFATDTDYIVTFWNPGAEKLYGIKAADALGQLSNEVVKTEFVGTTREKARKDLIKNGQFQGEIIQQDKQGKLLYVEMNSSVLRNKKNEIVGFLTINHNVTQRKKTEKALLETEERFKMVLENSLDAAYRWNFRTKRFDYASPVIEKISGFTQEEYQVMDWNFLAKRIHHDDLARVKKELESAERGKHDSGTIDYRFLRKDGKYIWISNRYAVIKDKNNLPLYRVGIVRDVTESKEIDRAKTEFISMAAHQLRTPLATISLSSEMLLSGAAGDIKEEEKECLGEIFNNVHKMTEMVEMFLNVSRIEMGRLSIEPKPLDALAEAEEIIKGVLPQIQAKNLKFKTDFEKLPEMEIDPKILRIAVENILSNAIKYTPNGGEINFKIKKIDKEAIFQISDTGYGIPKEHQEKLFTKLFRAGNIKAEGMGLGLYLAKNVIEQSGGKMNFESEENKGSTFYISIPLSGMKRKKISLGGQ